MIFTNINAASIPSGMLLPLPGAVKRPESHLGRAFTIYIRATNNKQAFVGAEPYVPILAKSLTSHALLFCPALWIGRQTHAKLPKGKRKVW